MEDQQSKKHREMIEAPIPNLIIRLAIPGVISMLVTSFYNMADTFFVGMLKNNSATGAVGIAFPVMAIIQAVGFFGHGSGAFTSRELGKKDYRKASQMVATGFVFSLLSGFVICGVGLVLLDPLAHILGATETILPYAKDYLRVIMLGAPWMTASLTLNNQLRYQGNAAYAMVGITVGSILNVVLDPLLIFSFELGVSGAAWATIISQFISFCLLFVGTMRGSSLRIQLTQVQTNREYWWNIVQGGFPALARQTLGSVATACLNLAAREYGDIAIAAMSITQRIVMVGDAAMLGFGQGFQPFCGFNYGAKRYLRVIKGFYFSVKTSVLFLTFAGLVGFIFAPQIISLFRDDPEVVTCGALSLRFQCAVLFTHSWVVMSTMMLQTIGRTYPATFLSVARQGLFLLPAILILPHFCGLLGVQMAQAVADCIALGFALVIHIPILKKMQEMEPYAEDIST